MTANRPNYFKSSLVNQDSEFTYVLPSTVKALHNNFGRWTGQLKKHFSPTLKSGFCLSLLLFRSSVSGQSGPPNSNHSKSPPNGPVPYHTEPPWVHGVLARHVGHLPGLQLPGFRGYSQVFRDHTFVPASFIRGPTGNGSSSFSAVSAAVCICPVLPWPTGRATAPIRPQ